MAVGRERGGIAELLDLIEERRDALAYDWRTRFHLGLDAVPEVMGWGEAVGHVRILRADPSSMLASAVEGWAFPISREALALYDIFDVTVQVNSDPKKGRPKPHSGRPYEIDGRDKTRRGNAAGRTREQVIAILNAHGHSIPV